MKRKNPPYHVEFSIAGQEPPAYVAAILKNTIVISGSKKQIKLLGLNKKLRFCSSGDFEQNQDLISLMLRLNEKGVAFSYDYKVALSPSDFMKSLQDRGILNHDFKEISWRSPKEWLLTTYELENT